MVSHRWIYRVLGILTCLAFFAIIPLFFNYVLGAPARPHANVLDVVVSEVAWMGTTTSSNDEWIELYNNTGSAVNLANWRLSSADGTPAITLTGSIPAHGYYLLERTDDNTVPGVTADQIYSGAMGDAGEYLTLQDGASVLVDEVDCGTAWFSGNSSGRVPMVRVNLTAAGDVAGNWTYNPRCGDATNSTGMSHTCVLTTTAVTASLDYAIYFNERATTEVTTTIVRTVKEQALLDLIDHATTGIDAAIYDLNRQSVIDALISAHNRGLVVRVVGDDEAALNESAAGYQALRAAGITVITDTNASIQHNKFMIFDGHTVWTGSTNFSDTGLTLNADNSFVMTDTTMAGVYRIEFEEMWSGLFHGTKSDNTAHLFNYQGTLVKNFFSPTDLVAFEVRDELLHADSTVHFGMFFWTDSLLTERMIERMNQGVELFGVWDQLGAGSAYSADALLCQAGGHIKIESFAGKVHHKFAVLDVFGSDPTVILGSYNWTDSGAYDNDENTLIIHDRAVAQAYYEEWQRLWVATDDARLCNPVAMAALTMTAGTLSQTVGSAISFNATVDPIATSPFTYTWQSPGLTTQTHVRYSHSDDVSFTWTTPGVWPVTVTVANPLGQMVESKLVTITALPVFTPVQTLVMTGPVGGYRNTMQTFTATVGPVDAIQPITYVWRIANAAAVKHFNMGLTDTVQFSWLDPGVYTVSVEASNYLAVLSTTRVITIDWPARIYLPLVMKP